MIKVTPDIKKLKKDVNYMNKFFVEIISFPFLLFNRLSASAITQHTSAVLDIVIH